MTPKKKTVWQVVCLIAIVAATASVQAAEKKTASEPSKAATGSKADSKAAANYYSTPAHAATQPSKKSPAAQSAPTIVSTSNEKPLYTSRYQITYQGGGNSATQQQSIQTASANQRPKFSLKNLFTHGRQSSNEAQYKPTGRVEVGKASWYGSDFHGGPTASGEKYNMNSMTAAHRTLPFGTMLKVTNLHNGREAVVRVNNRGPYVRSRMIDLSKGAAQTLGMVNRGVAKVKLEVLGTN